MVTAPCPKAKKPKARKKDTGCNNQPLNSHKVWQNIAGGMNCEKKSSRLKYEKTVQAVNSGKKTKLHYWSEKVSEGCRKGVWQRKEDRCVFSEGRYKRGEEAKSSFMPPTPTTPLSHLPPCGIFLHEWLCHTWGTKWSLSLSLPLFVSLSAPVLPTSTLVCLMW